MRMLQDGQSTKMVGGLLAGQSSELLEIEGFRQSPGMEDLQVGRSTGDTQDRQIRKFPGIKDPLFGQSSVILETDGLRQSSGVEGLQVGQSTRMLQVGQSRRMLRTGSFGVIRDGGCCRLHSPRW